MNSMYQAGEVVYVIIRNPHVQDVAQVQQAAIVENPDDPNTLALFLFDDYYPLHDSFAIYKTEKEAEVAYEEAFLHVGEDEFNG